MPGEKPAGGFATSEPHSSASIGASVIAAQRKLVDELLKLAGNDSPLAGLKADEVGGFDGGLASLADPARHETYASILSRAQRSELTVEADDLLAARAIVERLAADVFANPIIETWEVSPVSIVTAMAEPAAVG